MKTQKPAVWAAAAWLQQLTSGLLLQPWAKTGKAVISGPASVSCV
jgi:hypothetical protein